MRFAVIGAGVVGVTTAYALAKAGHHVSVFESDAGPGLGATAGNAGIITTGDALVWANPHALSMLPRAVFTATSPIRVLPSAGVGMLGWGIRFMYECRPARSRANSAALYGLAVASQRRFEQLVETETLDFAYRRHGGMLLFDSLPALRAGHQERAELKRLGHTYEVLGPSDIASLEPALAGSASKFAGALYTAQDSSGDSETFTRQLARACTHLGVRFHLQTPVDDFILRDSAVRAVSTKEGPHPTDAVVICAGSRSARLARRAGDRIPVRPVRGHCLTAPITNREAAPAIPGVHEGLRVAYSQLDGHMRLSSNAIFGSQSTTWTAKDFAGIHSAATQLFPEAADWSQVEYRARLRPSTPSSLPKIGSGKYRGVWYNTGHGHLGWTLAAGSADLLVSLVQGQKPSVSPAPFQLRS
jgi:D-amino-acid dehydrogenase